MIRCPMCRYSVDRYDLRTMGYNVSPLELKRIARGCTAFRFLMHSHQSVLRLSQVAHAIQDASSLTAKDGFIFNTCLLSLHRMIFQKASFAESLHAQLQLHRNPPLDRCSFISSSLACHVDVLMHTSNHGIVEA